MNANGRTLRLVLGDQLSPGLSSLQDCCDGDVILLAEVAEEATYVRHHRNKLVCLFPAIRRFARGLADGVNCVRDVRSNR
ncbi:cryptochrome/photolyase family protein [Hyphobacterium sp.]|uniref:cryptochrome/photolyase family protein n=1 Tax=Hyphobacterium sp. TaxID=2004662 RepID=UPI003B52A6EB